MSHTFSESVSGLLSLDLTTSMLACIPSQLIVLSSNLESGTPAYLDELVESDRASLVRIILISLSKHFLCYYNHANPLPFDLFHFKWLIPIPIMLYYQPSKIKLVLILFLIFLILCFGSLILNWFGEMNDRIIFWAIQN